MTTLIDHVRDKTRAADLRELNERISATEALLAGLRAAREEILDQTQRRFDFLPAEQLDPVLVASTADAMEEARLELALGRRLLEDLSEPGRDYME